MLSVLCRWLIGLSFVALAAGCTSSSALFHGWQVPSDDVLPITSAEGQWKTFDLTVDYHVQTSPHTLNLAGQAVLSQHYRILYVRLRQFNLYLFLVDQHGQVLRTVPLVFLGTAFTEDVKAFSVSVELPGEAAGFAFGYRGKVDEMDSHDRFHYLPVKPAK